MVSATVASTLARSVTSQRKNRQSPPALAPSVRADCAAASPAATSISATTTLAPSSAKRSAVALPMPPPPPVMKATFPASRAIACLSPVRIEGLFRRDLAVLFGDEVVRQLKARHRLEPPRPGFETRPAGDLDPTLGHEHHASPATDVGDGAGIPNQPLAPGKGLVDEAQ